MIVSPSLLSADFSNLGKAVDMINSSDADWLHLDIMDGVFVPNISFGFPVIKSITSHCQKPFDVHLMIVNPQNYISQVRDCGATIMNVHQEACTHLHRTIEAIHAAGMKAGVTINPATSVSTLEDIICDVDLVLLMSVNPGFGGQKFIPNTINKISRLRKLIRDSGSKALIQIDGGINMTTAPLVAEAGADSVVAGSAVFNAPDPTAVITFMHNL
jgi:ribulose-phosphate 3-epimerase